LHYRALRRYSQELFMSTILIIILILALIGVLPTWPHSRNWGYAPSGIGGLLILVLIIMLLTGRL
jgi:drug/metabolite transporter (DMT)-like permease